MRILVMSLMLSLIPNDQPFFLEFNVALWAGMYIYKYKICMHMEVGLIKFHNSLK